MDYCRWVASKSWKYWESSQRSWQWHTQDLIEEWNSTGRTGLDKQDSRAIEINDYG